MATQPTGDTGAMATEADDLWRAPRVLGQRPRDAGSWYATNRAAVERRVDWLWSEPEGVLYDGRSPLHRIQVRKEQTLIRMFFVDPSDAGPRPATSGCMAEYDLADPLRPLVAYNQAMLLPLLWIDDPRRIHVIGFAGARLPLLLHHYLPRAVIDGSDIEPQTVAVSERYFGVRYDERLSVAIEDGRRHLESRSPSGPYDLILIDAFRGTGFSPYHLATLEFHQLCRRHLTERGAVVANVTPFDPLVLSRIETMRAAFRSVYLHVDPTYVETLVLIGSDAAELGEERWRSSVARVNAERDLAFPLARRAADLRPVEEQAGFLERFGRSGGVLRDGAPPASIRQLPATDPIFYNAGPCDPCPCGSRRLFRDCHGGGPTTSIRPGPQIAED